MRAEARTNKHDTHVHGDARNAELVDTFAQIARVLHEALQLLVAHEPDLLPINQVKQMNDAE